MSDQFDEQGNLKKKNQADFVTGDFAAQESSKARGSGAGGEAVTQGQRDEILVGQASYDQENTDVADSGSATNEAAAESDSQ